jgi:hypothetical protein
MLPVNARASKICKKRRMDFPLQPPEGASLQRPRFQSPWLTFDLHLQNYERINLWHFKSINSWLFVKQPQKMYIATKLWDGLLRSQS